MGITVTIDKKEEAKYNRMINELIAVSDEPVKEVLRSQARLLCVDLSFHTDRYGKSKNVLEKHKKEIEDGINRIYPDAKNKIMWIRKKWGTRASLRLDQYISSGDIEKVQQMFDSAFKRKVKVIKWDNGKEHEKWTKNPRRKSNIILFNGESQKARFIRKKQARIGEAKSGWARAAEKLGGVANPTRGILGWAKKKAHKTKGNGMVSGKGAKTSVTIRNSSQYGMNKQKMDTAFRVRMDILRKKIDRIIKANERKAKKKAK